MFKVLEENTPAPEDNRLANDSDSRLSVHQKRRQSFETTAYYHRRSFGGRKNDG
jgi:hypothetical protein